MALCLGRNASTSIERHRVRAWLAAFRSAGTISPIVPDEHAAQSAPAYPAIVEMFGRFEMSIDGRPIPWARRRDREIVAFLAARPGGRATRAELVATFWPDADRQLAGQSLRTACSTIRRAIGACVGRTNVERYFTSDGALGLNLENMRISSHEFRRRYDLAASAYESGDYAGSVVHSRSAQLLYRSPFLAGEAPALWAAAHGRDLASMHGEVVARLDELTTG